MTQIQCETSTQKWEKFETWIGRNIFEFEGTLLQKLYCFFENFRKSNGFLAILTVF